MRWGAIAIAALAIAGCGGEDGSTRRDAGRDGGGVDAGTTDAGPPEEDAGPPEADAGPDDSGPPDAGPPDAGPPDAGPPDAGPECLTDGDCAAVEHCVASICVADLARGAACTRAAECPDGFCVDGVCCDRACTGTCETCASAVAPGTCSTHAARTDPDDECAGFSCAGYFAGFDGNTCYALRDVAGADAHCDGSGACEAPRDACGSAGFDFARPLVTCGLCERPMPGTCLGMVAGACGDASRTDDFAGTDLAAHWNRTAVGATPTFTVDGGRLTITDAGFAPTPSRGGPWSWIYDTDVDRGNQMTWMHPIGSGDFEVNVDMAWASTVAELTLGGVALVAADGTIEVFAGFQDGYELGEGGPTGWIRNPGAAADFGVGGTAGATGMIRWRITRASGVVRIERDGGAAMAEGPNGSAIAAVAIIAIAHRDGGGATYAFGTLQLDRLGICY